MVERKFAELVARMREAQKEARYWRDMEHYIAMRQLEREVDLQLLQLLNGQPAPQEQQV